MKKTISKFLSVLISAVMILSSCAFAVQAEQTDVQSQTDASDTAPGDVVAEPSYSDATENATEATDATEAQPIDPVSVSFDNTADGTTIKWQAVDSAAKYEVYLLQGDSYTLLTSTTDLSYTHAPLSDGETYNYSFKALDAEGNVIRDFADTDYTNIFIAPPVISKLTGTEEGVSITWEAKSAGSYRVYRSEAGKSWAAIADTAETSYVDKTAVSGVKYSYMVRSITADGKSLLSYFNSGKTISFVRTPSITSFDNTLTGTKITWNKPDGAVKFRLYYKNGTSWTRLCETADNSYVHDKLTAGKTYTYTVRGLDKNGNFVTEYNTNGWNNVFIKAPVITSLTNTGKGIDIRWGKSAGAVKYRVYYYGSKGWTRMADTTDTHYVDSDVVSGYHYTYTVRCINSEGTKFTSYFNSGVKTQYIGVPTISSIENTVSGAKLTWKKPSGASRFRVYVKNGSNWQRLTETTATSYVHENLTGGKSYTYTIRCVDSKGNFVSDYNTTGWSNTFIKAPVISSLTNKEKGVEIRWGKCAGAVKYRVYYYGSKGWTKLTETTGTSFLDTDVQSGYHYTYTVRCINSDGTKFTSGHNSGKMIQYISAPKITSVTNTETGAKIAWSKPSGASRFRVYVKSSSGWTRIAETASTSYVHDKLTNNKSYTYTVRCIDSKGNFVSDYNGTGWSNTFIKPPTISSISRSGNSNVVKWGAVSGASAYRLYRKGYKGSWSRIADNIKSTSYTDTTAKSNTLYAYTVRCLDAKGKLISDYFGSDCYYYNGKVANGNITVNGTALYFINGYLRKGYVTISGKTYYYNSSGILQKNGIVGSASEGYRYADKNGVIDYSYSNGVTSGGYDWIVQDGKARKVSSDTDQMVFYALQYVYKATDSSMSKSEKLRACFEYLQDADITEENPRIPDYTGIDWPILYATDIFEDNHGNCLSYAAVFGYMAKAIGYTEVYGCHSGGHGWTEIDGLIYDVEWSMHNFSYSYYAMSYSEPCDVAYASAIDFDVDWMHNKL